MIPDYLLDFNAEKCLHGGLNTQYMIWKTNGAKTDYEHVNMFFKYKLFEIFKFLNIHHFCYSEILAIMERDANPFPELNKDTDKVHSHDYFTKMKDDLYTIDWAGYCKWTLKNNIECELSSFNKAIGKLCESRDGVLDAVCSDGFDPRLSGCLVNNTNDCFRFFNQILNQYWHGSIYDLLFCPMMHFLKIDFLSLNKYYTYSDDVRKISYYPHPNMFSILIRSFNKFVDQLKFYHGILSRCTKYDLNWFYTLYLNHPELDRDSRIIIMDVFDSWMNAGVFSKLGFTFNENVVNSLMKFSTSTLMDSGSKLLLDYPLVI